MEYLVPILAAVAIYAFARWYERQANERRQLRWFFPGDTSPEGIIDSWRFDLLEMTVEHHFTQVGDPTRVRRFQLVRNASGWWMQLTGESYMDEVRQLQAWLQADNFMNKDTLRERLRELDNGPVWWPVPSAGPLESQYQRFIAHYRA